MKKRNILTALAGLVLGFGGAVQLNATAPAPVRTVITVNADKEAPPKQRIKQTREIGLDGTGGLDFPFYDRGRSPKEYGQYLQATRRQKWNKKK